MLHHSFATITVHRLKEVNESFTMGIVDEVRLAVKVLRTKNWKFKRETLSSYTYLRTCMRFKFREVKVKSPKS